MSEEKISNEKLYELIVNGFQKMGERVDQTNERVDYFHTDLSAQIALLSGEIDLLKEKQKHFEEHFLRELDVLRKQGERLERQLENVKESLRDVSKRVDEVYDCRKTVSVHFTYRWAIASLMLALFASATTLFFGKSFM